MLTSSRESTPSVQLPKAVMVSSGLLFSLKMQPCSSCLKSQEVIIWVIHEVQNSLCIVPTEVAPGKQENLSWADGRVGEIGARV